MLGNYIFVKKVNTLLSKDLENIKEKLKNVNMDESDPEIVIRLVKDIKKELFKLNSQVKGKESKLESELVKRMMKDPFTREDIFNIFSNISKEEIIKLLNKLIRKEKIFTVGRNLYTLQSIGKEPVIHLSEEVEKIRKILNDNSINYIITGLDILKEYVNLIPKRMIHLIYVVKGSGELAKNIIEKKTNRICVLNPIRTEIRNIFSHYGDDIIVLREVGESSIEYHNQGIASLEKAIVDLYFETTRKRIPFSNPELVNILKNIFLGTKIEYTKLIRAATRRNMNAEFVLILKQLDIQLPIDSIQSDYDESKIEKILNLFRR
jgi:hypothetical protein